MKKRGLASPDDGDALVLTFAQPLAPLTPERRGDDDEEYGSRYTGISPFSSGPGGWMR
jgi:hypothetical protein